MHPSPRIVVSGFEPFGGGTENPSLAVLTELRAANDIAGDLTTLALPVDSARLAGLVEATLDEVKPDIWIGLGLAVGLAVVAVERIAANVMDFAIPDNAGLQHGGGPIFETGPAGYLATLPIKRIVSAIRAIGIPAKISNSASTYLCNQMMYTVLHLIAEKGFPTRAGFIHVPAHPAFAARQVHPHIDMPSMSIDLVTAAVKTAIATTGSRNQDHREPTISD